MGSNFFVMRKGSGEMSLIENGTVVLQQQVFENKVVELFSEVAQADTLIFVCNSSRGCLYELWKNGTHKQSVTIRNRKISTLSLVQQTPMLWTTEVTGFEGDTLPTIFWTIPYDIQCVNMSTQDPQFFGYRLNEQESCLQGTLIPFQQSSHSLDIVVSSKQETVKMQSVLTIHGRILLHFSLTGNREVLNLMPVEFRVTIPRSNSSIPFFSIMNGTIMANYSKYPFVYTPTVSQFLEIISDTYIISFDPDDECIVEVLVHGVTIAVRERNQSQLKFTLFSHIPFRSTGWRAITATPEIINVFMDPDFDVSNWDKYTAGEAYTVTDRVWLLRRQFIVGSIPQGLGLYYQLQEGMLVYINGHLVFSVDMNDDLSMESTSNSRSPKLKIGRAVLTSSWLVEGTWNIIAIAATSSSSSSSIQISLFSLVSSLSVISRSIIVSSSTVELVSLFHF